MTSIDLEKIWLWIGEESRAYEKIEDKTISLEDGVAYVDKWLTAVSSEQLFRVSRAMAERGEQALAQELEQRAIERQRGLRTPTSRLCTMHVISRRALTTF